MNQPCTRPTITLRRINIRTKWLLHTCIYGSFVAAYQHFEAAALEHQPYIPFYAVFDPVVSKHCHLFTFCMHMYTYKTYIEGGTCCEVHNYILNKF